MEGIIDMNHAKIKAINLMLCLTLSLFTSCSTSNKSNAVNINQINSKETDFLKDNHANIDTTDNNNFSTFKLLDSALEGKEVFFTAENHGVATNSELEIKFLKYFKQKTGIKYLLLEISYSDGQVLNKYMSTGDESILEEMYKPLKGTFAWNKQSYGIWRKLYEFNKSLPEDERIKIIGIDIEHQYTNAIRYMESLIPDRKAPQEIADFISKLNVIYNKISKDPFAYAYVDFSNKLDESIKSNHKVYEEYFGEKLFDFELVNENIIAQVKAYEGKTNNSFNQIRDSKMYDNFKKIYLRMPNGKFYGQWGLNHTFQKRQASVDWLASLMNSSDSPVKGRILSIVYLYDNCEMMCRDYKTTELNTLASDKEKLDLFAKEDITLFKLTGKASPFEKELIWLFSENGCGDKPIEGVTTDYFQYMILIKNAKATTPLGK